jgi:hypothetical protein
MEAEARERERENRSGSDGGDFKFFVWGEAALG